MVPKALILYTHSNYFETKGVTNIQISFKLHNAKLEQCCCMTFVSSLPLVVFFLVYLRGKAGHKESKTKLRKFVLGDWEKFRVDHLLHA